MMAYRMWGFGCSPNHYWPLGKILIEIERKLGRRLLPSWYNCEDDSLEFVAPELGSDYLESLGCHVEVVERDRIEPYELK